MTLSYDSKKEYEKEKEKERNPAIDWCDECGLEIHNSSWITDEEGYRFCDEDCKQFHKEERPENGVHTE